MDFPATWQAFAGIDTAKIPMVPEPAFPSITDRYRALKLVEPGSVRVVLLGQDPYHDDGQAHGLAFSVPSQMSIPPSLRNIFRELASDLGVRPPSTGDLSGWAEQGVLLLNTALSVAPHRPGSHAALGWNYVTDRIVTALGNARPPKVFILWGKSAQQKFALIDSTMGHLVLMAPHPSPLSAHRGFFGSRPFSQTNNWLLAQGQQPIQWA